MPEIIPNWHPLLVHFTLAPFVIAVAMYIFGYFRPAFQSTAWLVAQWNLYIAAVAVILTVAAGVYAFNTVNHDDVSHQVMIIHRNLALPTALVILVLAGWSYRAANRVSLPFLSLALFALLGVSVTAWYGGELVYRHGLGVMSLPAAEGEAHGHDHAHGGHEAMPESEHHQDAIHEDRIPEQKERPHDHDGHTH